MPEHEAERLEAIHQLGLPPSEPDPLLDDEMEVLAKSLDMPIAFFSLVDASRQLLLGASGLPDALDESRVTPRSHSLCGHVVADNETYIIGDIQKNRHFSGNPLLREHGFRFYAGAPVHAPNGQAIGSLCVMDHKPRRLTPRQKQKLEKAAKELSEKLAVAASGSDSEDKPFLDLAGSMESTPDLSQKRGFDP
jgi:GAF domain-containing protein